MAIEFEAGTSPYQFIGEEYQLGSLQLTMLAQSFYQIARTPLGEFFPDRNIPERTIVVEQIIEGLGIMPIVRFGVPSGGFLEQNRIRAFTARPAVVREDDFIEQHLINQLRQPGTFNQAYRPEDIVQRRVQQLVARHARTKDLFITKALLGGINYTDPRTGVSINVSSNIPLHNNFRYDGFDSNVTNGASIPGTGFTAAKTLQNNKGRKEALMFKSTDQRAGVAWTDPKADVIYCLRLLKEYLRKTNKNTFTDIIISTDLLTILMENEYIKSLSNVPGVLVYNAPTSTVAGNANIVTSTGGAPATYITMGPGGEITSIAGLRITAVDGMYRDPVDNKIKTYWPAHRVALVARNAIDNPSATLGFTYHCSGESPDGNPGIFVRTSAMSEPPAPPGRVMQMGDAFLPVVIYPHWISILDVCDEGELSNKFIIQSNLAYGTF